MTFERNPGPPPEPGPTPVVGSAAPGSVPTPVQVRLQILSTEHWSLLASRSLAWNEIFSRAGMFLSTLSGSMVALGLIGGIDGFGDPFFTFALVILPVVLFVGLGTWARMGVANYHDAMTVYGMNRIRGAYLEIAPEMEPYFVMGVHDDPQGIGVTMGMPPGTSMVVHLISSTPFLIVVLNAVLAGAIAALAFIRFVNASGQVTLAGAIIVALVLLGIQLGYARGRIRAGQNAVVPMFPTPDAGGARETIFGAELPRPSGRTMPGADRRDPPDRPGA
ncbi:MAG TPA: hypothetical protein VHM48_09175 [Candidatus Limnocylindrales bacterium]|nr:hypothetical protein [Candidatus Limnocylindrales bacterium]